MDRPRKPAARAVHGAHRRVVRSAAWAGRLAELGRRDPESTGPLAFPRTSGSSGRRSRIAPLVRTRLGGLACDGCFFTSRLEAHAARRAPPSLAGGAVDED